MCDISSKTGSDCYGTSSVENRGIAESFTRKNYYKELIDLADTVPLLKIFKYYNIRCNSHSFQMRCPFKSHKGGRESTPSFHYYHETNSFNCFGCRKGGNFAHASHFVAAMEDITTAAAANKIILIFKDDLDNNKIDNDLFDNFDEQMNLMLEFSNYIRNFHDTYSTDDARAYIEKICMVYDKFSSKFKLNNKALKSLISQLKEVINLYSP